MANVLLLIACLLLGVVLRRWRVTPPDSHLTLNALIVYVFLPAITLRYTVDLQFTRAFLTPVAATWLVFGASFLFFNLIGKRLQLDRRTIGALIVVAGISSISFTGFPIFELLYGAEGLRAGIVMSQAGTFIVCSTAGIMVCSVYAADSERLDWLKIGRDILFFPPFTAFAAAIALKMAAYTHPPVVAQFLERLGAPMSVAALLSIGLQMNFSAAPALRRAVRLGLLFKLVLAPLLVYVLFIVLLKQTDTAARVSVVGSGLGSMNTIGIVAIRKGLNPPLVTKLLAVSIPLSLLLVPLVYRILTF